MGASKSTDTAVNRKYYKLRITDSSNSGKKSLPRFIESIKANGKWVNGQSFDKFDGYLKDIQVDELTDKASGKKKKFIQITMVDENGESSISVGLNFLSRGLINTLCNIPDISTEKIYISLWESKPDPKFPKSGYYPMCSVRVGTDSGPTVRYKYKPDAILLKAPVKEFEVNGEIIKDYTDLNNYHFELIEKVIKPMISVPPVKVGKGIKAKDILAPSNIPLPNDVKAPEKVITDVNDFIEDDLPF